MSTNPRAAGADHPPSTRGALVERARRWPIRAGLIALLGIGVAAPMVAAADPASAPEANRSSRIATVAEARPAATVTTTTEPGPSKADITKLERAIWINKVNENRWIAATNARLAAEAARKAADAKAAATKAAAARAAAPQGRCGGNLPPCWVMQRESRGNIRAQNPSSSASGKWQFIDSTWAGFGGYAHAWQAPESVQDAKAAQLWAGGRGCGHWSAC